MYDATAHNANVEPKTGILKSWSKKGVNQMLQRYNCMQPISFLNHIDSKNSDSVSKMIKPRRLDPSSVPFLCVTTDTE